MPEDKTFATAILEATSTSLEQDHNVLLFGLGVPDPKGIFGTTLGLQERFGSERVFDMPLAENAMTGFAIGAALSGARPILTHQRLDFALVSIEQIVNQAAKWQYMFGGTMSCPLVIRMIIGRGWGQGPQHSQSLQSWFAHIPGLRVLMPSNPSDAWFALRSAVKGDSPTVILEHRWLYGQKGEIDYSADTPEFGGSKKVRSGKDISIASYSFSLVECLKAADWLSKHYGIECDLVDIRSMRPLELSALFCSVKQTKKLLMVDQSVRSCGVGAEVVASLAENQPAVGPIKVKRLSYPDIATPTSPHLARHYYFGVKGVVKSVLDMLGVAHAALPEDFGLGDQPDPSFQGPF